MSTCRHGRQAPGWSGSPRFPGCEECGWLPVQVASSIGFSSIGLYVGRCYRFFLSVASNRTDFSQPLHYSRQKIRGETMNSDDWRVAILVHPSLTLGELANTVAVLGIGLGAAHPALAGAQLTDGQRRQ